MIVMGKGDHRKEFHAMRYQPTNENKRRKGREEEKRKV